MVDMEAYLMACFRSARRREASSRCGSRALPAAQWLFARAVA